MYVISGRGTCVYSGRPDQLEAHLLDTYGVACIEDHVNPVDRIIHVASLRQREKKDLPSLTIFDRIFLVVQYFRIKWQNYRNVKEETLLDTQKQMMYRTAPLDNEFPGINLNSIEHSEDTIRSQIRQLNNDKLGGLKLFGQLTPNTSPIRIQHILYLWFRSVKNGVWNNKEATFMQLSMYVILGAILAIIYDRDLGKANDCDFGMKVIDPFNCSCNMATDRMNIDKERPTVQNIKFQFFSILFQMFAALMPTVLTFPFEIRVFLSEQFNGWYCTTSYYIAKTLASSIVLLLFPYFYIAILYYATGQIGSESIWDVIPFSCSDRFNQYFWCVSFKILSNIVLISGFLLISKTDF